MSLHTDGTEVYLPSATIWPGEVDYSLRKAYDVAIPGGPKINLQDTAEDDKNVSLSQKSAQAGEQQRLISKLGDSHIFENNHTLTKHMYNPDQESVPNTKLLSVRDWRRG